MSTGNGWEQVRIFLIEMDIIIWIFAIQDFQE